MMSKINPATAVGIAIGACLLLALVVWRYAGGASSSAASLTSETPKPIAGMPSFGHPPGEHVIGKGGGGPGALPGNASPAPTAR